MSKWNGSDEPAGRNMMAEQRYTLTKRGMVAAICLAAEPFTVTPIGTATCQVTVYPPITPRPHNRGELTYLGRPCGDLVTAGGLCAKREADRERLR